MAETYPALRDVRVVDAMHHGLVSCPVDAPLRTVARMMATHRVHAILVIAHGEHEFPGGHLWGTRMPTCSMPPKRGIWTRRRPDPSPLQPR